MTTDDRGPIPIDDPFYRGTLEHVSGLIDGADALLDKSLPHLGYHLALLALEEIGKLEILSVGRVGTDEEEAAFKRKFIDDHVGKIFWAFWGPTFSRQTIDRNQIEWHQQFAKQLHEKRLRGLYTEPADQGFIAPVDHVSEDDAKSVINMARLRLEMQKEREPANLSDDEKADLAWFKRSRYDSETRDFIVSGNSMKKLTELQNVRLWMKWLREIVEARSAELLELTEAELRREVHEDDINKPKWKFRIRLHSNSHHIRPKAIKAWNKITPLVQWAFVDKKKTTQVIVEFLLPKTVQGKDLYHVGLAHAYRFLIALNIGSRGFFWFDLPLQTESFDESIEDLETGALLHVGRVPTRRIDRQMEDLQESHVGWISLVYSLLPHDGPQLAAFRRYLGGLMYWAKTDIHSGFEVQAFRAFFETFQMAMMLVGDWDGKSPFRDAALRVLSTIVQNPEEAADDILGIVSNFQAGQPPPELNVEQAAVMKLITDVYLLGIFDRQLRSHPPDSDPNP